jgi:hypothetical protein
MKLLKNKKGDDFLITATTVEFILIIIIVGLIILIIAREQQNDKFEKLFLAKDVGMFVDSLYASPNSVLVKYPQEAKGYSYKMESGKITVYKESQTLAYGESYPFSEQTSILFMPKDITLTDQSGEDSVDEIPIIFRKTKTKIVPIPGIIIGSGK